MLAAKDEWHARVGVVCAGFLHIIMPFFFIVPGIIAFKMFPKLPHPDQVGQGGVTANYRYTNRARPFR